MEGDNIDTYIEETGERVGSEALQALSTQEAGAPPKWKRCGKPILMQHKKVSGNKIKSIAREKRIRNENCDLNVHFSRNTKKLKYVIDWIREDMVLGETVSGAQPCREQ